MNADLSPDTLRTIPLEQLEQMLRAAPSSSLPPLLEALGHRRGYQVARVLETYVTHADGPVRQAARDARDRVVLDTDLFGSGTLMRLELPPRLRTLEEERRGTRLLIGMWLVGAFLFVNALLIWEHTGAMWLPMVGSLVLTTAIMMLSLRLRQDPVSPGWLFLDEEEQVIRIEMQKPEGGIDTQMHPWSSLRALHRITRRLPAPEDEPGGDVIELMLELDNGESLLIARREREKEMGELIDRLCAHLPAPLPVFTARLEAVTETSSGR